MKAQFFTICLALAVILLPACSTKPIVDGIGNVLGISNKAKQKKATRSVIQSTADASEAAKQ